jgi:hypothetical protein
MARAKKKEPQEKPVDSWEYYESIQLTPEQKAAAREELKKAAEEAARNGVYERLLGLMGTVHVQYDIDKLREDRD